MKEEGLLYLAMILEVYFMKHILFFGQYFRLTL
jgi:hypothetical protein